MLPSCTLCGFSRANSLHYVLFCPFVKDVWREASVLLPFGSNHEVNPLDLLPHLFDLNTHVDKETIVAITWGLWKRRCD